MILFIIAALILVVAGIASTIQPELFLKADQRDDPNAVEQVKKIGPMLIGFSVGAILLLLKYKLT